MQMNCQLLLSNEYIVINIKKEQLTDGLLVLVLLVLLLLLL